MVGDMVSVRYHDICHLSVRLVYVQLIYVTGVTRNTRPWSIGKGHDSCL